jgi:hypothetical protein
MQRLLTLLAVAVACCPSVSQANCAAAGTIPRIFVSSGGATADIGVRGNGPGSTFFNFTTTSSNVISAALSAEASHMTVVITGNASNCPAPTGGLSQGGAVVAITVSP